MADKDKDKKIKKTKKIKLKHMAAFIALFM